MPLYPRWRRILNESGRQALVAVDFYNRAGDRRSLHDFVVHMHLAWLHLLHAEFEQAGVSYIYCDSSTGRPIKIDGESKTWDLDRCLSERYSNGDPVRMNIEFFIRLRNRIEHRYQHALAAITSGEAHALVINYELERIARFGTEFSLANELRFPIFLEVLTPSRVVELRKATRSLPKSTQNFLTRYRNALDPAVRDSDRFEYRVMLTPLKGPKTEADTAVSFVPARELTEEKVKEMQAKGQVGTAIVVEKPRDVVAQNELLASEVVKLVNQSLPYDFTQHHHNRLVQHHHLKNDPKDPVKTNIAYCLWHRQFKRHVYTQAWVKKILKDYATADRLAAVVGKLPTS